MRGLAAFGVLLSICAAPAAAQSARACHEEAARLAYSGSKSGYSAHYNAIYAECMARNGADYRGGTGRDPLNRPRTITHVDGPCPADVPVLYRGTLYCFR